MMGTDIRVVYSDLDGTMLGPGGCFFRSPVGDVTLEPATALVELHRAGIALVLVSGRSHESVREAGDIFGADGFIGEIGGIVGHEGGHRIDVMRGTMPAQFEGTPVQAMRAGGVLELLQRRWPGRLQLHDPWHADHQVDLLLRGDVPVAEADQVLAEHGFGWLRLHDNGVMTPDRRFAGLDVDPIHFYHLLPEGISKAIAVEADLRRRGLSAANAIAIGDSLSDMQMAPYVGRMFLVANGRQAYTPADNVELTDAAMGLGWASAIRYAVAHAAPTTS